MIGINNAIIFNEGFKPFFSSCNNVGSIQSCRRPENKEAKSRILEAQKLGVQTLVDLLLGIYMQDISGRQLDPNVIAWTREKTKFIQFLATKITDLYSDNKPQESNVKQTITVSWLDSPELQRQYLDLEAEELQEVKTREISEKPSN